MFKLNWMIGPVFASALVAFGLMKAFDLAQGFLFSGVKENVANTARASLFVGAWTAVTAGLGDHALTERVRGWRQGLSGARRRLNGDK